LTCGLTRLRARWPRSRIKSGVILSAIAVKQKKQMTLCQLQMT
jgi:hypothetical protein